MPFRFRKSVKILPGIKLNLSKGGISTSIGGRGHSVNLGKHGARSTVGIPGTGLSYSSSTHKSHSSDSGRSTSTGAGCGCVTLPFLLLMKAFSLLFNAFLMLVSLTIQLSKWLWHQATSTQERKLISAAIVAGALMLFTSVTIVSTAMSALGLISTPQPTLDLNPLRTQAAITAWAPITLTAAARPKNTVTFIATPSSTITPYLIQTLPSLNTASPTLVSVPTTSYFPPTSSGHPAGKTGQCFDGTYTSASHKQGACSNHGGVALWWGS